MSELRPGQLEVLEGLEEALAELGDTPTADDVYELASTLGQARRLLRVVSAERLQAAVTRGEEAWRAHGDSAALAALDSDALVESLDACLEDDDVHPLTVFGLLFDADGHACAARVAGAPAAAVPLLDQVELLVSLHAERTAALSDVARGFVEEQGVRSGDAEAALWQAVVDAAEAPEFVESPISDETIAGWLDAEAAEGLLVLLPPAPAALGAPAAYAKAAGMDFAPEAEATPLAADEDAGWELVLERPGPRLELVLYDDPRDPVPFRVTSGGRTLSIADDGDGRRAVVLADQTELGIEVAGRRLRARVPE